MLHGDHQALPCHPHLQCWCCASEPTGPYQGMSFHAHTPNDEIQYIRNCFTVKMIYLINLFILIMTKMLKETEAHDWNECKSLFKQASWFLLPFKYYMNEALKTNKYITWGKIIRGLVGYDASYRMKISRKHMVIIRSKYECNWWSTGWRLHSFLGLTFTVKWADPGYLKMLFELKSFWNCQWKWCWHFIVIMVMIMNIIDDNW